MEETQREVVIDLLSWMKVYKDGTIDRFWGQEVTPATFDSQTGVTSKDIVIFPETGVSVRLYRPTLPPSTNQKLPIFVYYHGGGFTLGSTADPKYHNIMNKVVAEAKVIGVSVDYRRAPEHPLPTAYDDSWAALQWVVAHAKPGSGSSVTDDWLKENVDFDRVFIGGDSAGANITHHTAIRVGSTDHGSGLKIIGLILIHPYFWGKDPIERPEAEKGVFSKSVMDKCVEFVFNKGVDDPFINPFAGGSEDISGLGCDRVMVCLAEKDILWERGKFYYESLVKSKWKGKAELVHTDGEDHVFHLYDPNCEKAVKLIKAFAAFINQA